ncbi:MAG: RHS repeat protein, partial [Lewinellaceae bacterium]|nr:RHS repeat protein [Lewinellaceae bacterium]
MEKFGEGAEYGVVEHIFTSGLDYPDERISIFPFPPPISSREWRKGKLKAQNIFDSSNNLLKSVENEYEARPSPYSESKGLKVGGLMYNVITAPSQVGYIAVQYKHISEWFALKSASETLDGAVKNSAFFYDGNGTPTAPVAIEFVNSDGKTHRTEFVYAPQAAHSGCMMGKYMVGIPVETKELINGNPASGAKAEYAPDNGRCLPKRYYAWEGAWELRTEITQYDSDAFPEIVSHTALPEPEYYSWANGLLSSKTYKDWRQTWGYYSDTRLMESFTDIDGQTINYSYDGFQRLKTVLAREGNVSSSYVYQYGAPNRITNTTAYTDDTPTQTIEEEFDGLGRLVKQSHNGVPKQEIFYDNAGRIARETYLVGSYVKYINEPSPLGRVLITTFPDGYKVQNKYSSENNYYKTTTIDEKGNASDVLTDFLGRQGKFRDALGGETVFSYDAQGDLASITNPGGGQYLYTYDLGHRVESKTIPGKGMQVFRYYPDNKLLKYSLDANGNRLDYTYDDYNREKLVRFNDIGNWDPMAIPPSHGSPGSKILEYGYGEGTGEPINIGKMMWSDAKVLDGTGTNFVNTKFTYETYGRLDGQYETHPLGFDSYDFIYNLADWLTFEDRTHLGPQSIDMRTVRKYDRFGRETGYFIFAGPGSGNYISDGFILGRSYNIKDQVKAKYYGSLDAFSALDKVKFKYNIRGWVTDMNDIVYDELQFDECGTAFGLHGDTVQIEQTVALEELLEIICTEGEEVAINGLDPCANGDCYEVLSDYSARFIVGAFEGYHGFQSPDYLWGVRANGQLIPLNYPYYFHDGSSRNQFVTDLGNWMAQNGWRHESISFTADLVNQGVKRPYYDVSIVVTGTDLNFEIAYEGRDVANQVAHPFSVKHRPPVLCSGLPESPSGEGQDVETVKGLLEQEIANQALDNLALPAVLYKTHFPDSSYYWAFGQELKNIPAIYQRSKRVHVSNGQQSLFLEGETEGEGESVALEEFIDNRGSMVMPKGIHDGGPPSDECDLPELECTETEIEEQYESVAEIQNEMCNIDPANLEYPVTMYLVQLCDGTRMYILGANLLSQLEGTYLILDELVIESPAQEFDIVVTQRRPLFAMKFEAYEPNGNIKE